MTNEEMLKVLEDLKYQFDDRIAESEYSKDKDLLEALQSNKMASKALDMAIKALEQQPCEDCISRQSIKHKLQEHHDFFINAYGGFSNMSQNDKSRVDEIINCIAMVVNEPSVTSKQQPCEDAISRQAILDIIMPYCQDDDGSVENTGDLRNALDDIESLPPVTPKKKAGHWIEGGYEDMYYVCSECDYKASEYWYKPSYKYCPNCGARMVSE